MTFPVLITPCSPTPHPSFLAPSVYVSLSSSTVIHISQRLSSLSLIVPPGAFQNMSAILTGALWAVCAPIGKRFTGKCLCEGGSFLPIHRYVICIFQWKCILQKDCWGESIHFSVWYINSPVDHQLPALPAILVFQWDPRHRTRQDFKESEGGRCHALGDCA